MNQKEDHKLTLDEDLERYNYSTGLAPEEAASKVLQFINLEAIHWFRDEGDIEQLCSLFEEAGKRGEDIDIDHYGGFCEIFDEIPNDILNHNAILLMLLYFISALNSTKEGGSPVKACLDMTLREYLNALYDLLIKDKIFASRIYMYKKSDPFCHDTLDKPVSFLLEKYFDTYMIYMKKFEYLEYLIDAAVKSTALKNNWVATSEKEGCDSPAEFFKKKKAEFCTDCSSLDIILQDYMDTSSFFLKEKHYLMAQEKSFRKYLQNQLIDPEFLACINDYFKDAHLSSAMMTLTSITFDFDWLFIQMPRLIYVRGYQFTEHHEI